MNLKKIVCMYTKSNFRSINRKVLWRNACGTFLLCYFSNILKFYLYVYFFCILVALMKDRCLFMEEYFLNLVKGYPTRGEFRTMSKYCNHYADYLQRSLDSLDFSDYVKDSFATHLKDYRKCWDTFFRSGNVIEVGRAKLEIMNIQEVLEYYEKSIKYTFGVDLSKNLSCNPGEYTEFAILVEPTKQCEFIYPGRSCTIECSLFTENLQALECGCTLGYVYDLLERDLVIASTQDVDYRFHSPLRFDAKLPYHALIDSALEHTCLAGQSFRFFKDFVSHCDPEYPNKIIFARSSYSGQLPLAFFFMRRLLRRIVS